MWPLHLVLAAREIVPGCLGIAFPTVSSLEIEKSAKVRPLVGAVLQTSAFRLRSVAKSAKVKNPSQVLGVSVLQRSVLPLKGVAKSANRVSIYG